MKLSKERMVLYAVTDRHWVGKESLYEQVEKAIEGGATFVQLREKNLSTEEFISEAKEISKLCKKHNVPFVINDNIDVAIASEADGVHLGQDDMDPIKARELLGDNKIIGVSTHNVEEAIKAKEMGADYLGAGAVFSTSTKGNVTNLSKEELKAICEAVDIPVVAIGGINHENIQKLSGSKIAGVAVVSAIFGAEDIVKSTKELKEMANNLG